MLATQLIVLAYVRTGSRTQLVDLDEPVAQVPRILVHDRLRLELARIHDAFGRSVLAAASSVEQALINATVT